MQANLVELSRANMVTITRPNGDKTTFRDPRPVGFDPI